MENSKFRQEPSPPPQDLKMVSDTLYQVLVL